MGDGAFSSPTYPTELLELISGGETTLHSHAGGAALPAGIICMWSGLLANIPSGWALCDGASGRPDLRSKFIKGAAPEVEPGDIGGAATHDHDAHPNHVFTQPSAHDNHVFTQPSAHTDVINHTHPVTDPGHTHVLTELRDATTGSATTNIALTADTSSTIGTKVTGSRVTGLTTTNPAGGVASLTHANGAVDAHSAHAGADVDAHSAHSSESNEPEYYTLAFIIKT